MKFLGLRIYHGKVGIKQLISFFSCMNEVLISLEIGSFNFTKFNDFWTTKSFLRLFLDICGFGVKVNGK